MIRRAWVVTALSVVIAGIIGVLVLQPGDAPPTVVDQTFRIATPAPTPTATPRPTATATPERRSETVEELVFLLNTALARDDTDFILSRLHPLAVSAAGRDVCRAYIEDDFASSLGLALAGPISGPARVTRTAAGLTQIIRKHYTAAVVVRYETQEFELEAEFAESGGRMYWFSSCS